MRILNNIHYFCLAKELQKNTHSIIRKYLARTPWETNHPKQARNLRDSLLQVRGKYSAKNRNFSNLSDVSCCPHYTDWKLIKTPRIFKTPYRRNWRCWGTSGPLLRKKAVFQQRTNVWPHNIWINQRPAKEATLNIVTGLITRQNLFPILLALLTIAWFLPPFVCTDPPLLSPCRVSRCPQNKQLARETWT